MAGIFGLIGAAAGWAGQKPTVPTLPTISPGGAAATATAANIANLPQAEKLASGVNLFNQNELLQMLTRGIPGYQQTQQAESQTIQSLIKGQIPDANLVATKAAARAAGLGISGGEGATDLSMRDLGIASLQATEAGLQAADRWMRTTDAMTNPGLYNVSSAFVTPAQQLAADEWNATNQFKVDWLKNQIRAAPGPMQQEAMGIMGWLDETGKSVASSYIGGATGASGGGGGGGGGNSGVMDEFYGLGAENTFGSPSDEFNVGGSSPTAPFNINRLT